jgi:lipopolysaccharide/colanic/teichoic acid biosynthesis glycosyltransferase
MILNITDPAIMFPGISLLFLAYTNRYLSLASVIRALNKDIKNNDEHDINMAQQIQKLNLRIRLIKYMQAFGVLAFLFCVFSMLMLMWELQLMGEIFFVASLVAMTISLVVSLIEILKSEQSLRIELDRTHVRDQWKKD